ncbi:MAG: hypothetical protein U5M53_07415 [Rhodoferax sp.]|nr:hypothetical protein [Rhodoferax sp.]
MFLTDAADLDLVSRALPTHGFTVSSAKLGYQAQKPYRPHQPERRGNWTEVEEFSGRR